MLHHLRKITKVNFISLYLSLNVLKITTSQVLKKLLKNKFIKPSIV